MSQIAYHVVNNPIQLHAHQGNRHKRNWMTRDWENVPALHKHSQSHHKVQEEEHQDKDMQNLKRIHPILWTGGSCCKKSALSIAVRHKVTQVRARS